jgi:hypothetical protein
LIDREVGLVVSEKSVTETRAVPEMLPLAAVTVKGPPTVLAVNSPDELLIEPPPLTDQVNDGWGLIGLLFWS